MFWNKNKQIKSEEYEDLIKRIGSLRADIEDLKAKVEKHDVRILTAKKKEKLLADADAEFNELNPERLKELETYLRANGFN